MKLVTLEFEGIGSFADPMRIDFEALGGAGLFLVEGPTGSGKSTILDAIVFALYGSTAGSNSDLGRMDSHVRNRSHAPYVSLVFEVSGARYEIRRTPRHQRDKRRGSGVTDDNGAVSLMRLTPQICEISHKAREVGDWVIEHVGLTKPQFAATIVLAQGEFASFLDANTETRAQILERVFGTEFYKQVEDQLASMRKTAVAQRQRADAAVRETTHLCLGALGLEPAEDDPRRIDEQLEALTGQLRTATEAANHADLAVTHAHSLLQDGERLHADQIRKRDLLARCADLDARRADIDDSRCAVTDHQRAMPVRPVHLAYERARARARDGHDRLAEARGRLADTGVDQACASAVEASTRVIGSLQPALAAEQGLPGLRQHALAAEQEAALAIGRLEQQQQAQALLVAQLDQARAVLLELPAQPDRLAELTVALDQTRSAIRVRRQADEVADDLARAREHQQVTHEDLDLAEAALSHARQLRDLDAAAALAAQLADGHPCLVCGGTEHPHPAQPVDVSVDRAVIAELERDVRVAQEEFSTRAAIADQLHGRWLTLQSAAGPDLPDPGHRLAEIEADIAAAQQAHTAREQAVALVDALARDVQDATAGLASEQVRAQGADGAAKHARQVFVTSEELVVRARADSVTVAERIDRLQRQVDVITELLDLSATAARSRDEADKSHEVLLQTLAAVGFPDADTAAAAWLPEDRLADLHAQIDSYDQQRGDVDAGLSELAEVDLEATVDLVVLRADLAWHRDRQARAHETKGGLESRQRQAVPLRNHLADCLKAQHEVRVHTDATIRMADLAAASRSEVIHRVKLSSFVLMRRFQSVVDAANDRLDAISEGRYQLVVEHKGLDNRGLAGLDLLVADQRTEHTRSAKSLSGGERFYVALALALGLADVVRSESGGLELGTLFIDEGFGSLDAETLEEVIDMLEHVRAGEDRVIGLVSHVELLKRRIDARISVRPDPSRPAVSMLQVHV